MLEVSVQVLATVPIERTPDYEQHVLSVSVSISTSRLTSSTVVTSFSSVFCIVTFPCM